eukprot:1069094-Prymnesium_polylepis.1
MMDQCAIYLLIVRRPQPKPNPNRKPNPPPASQPSARTRASRRLEPLPNGTRCLHALFYSTQPKPHQSGQAPFGSSFSYAV